MKTKTLLFMAFCLLMGLEGQTQSYTTIPYCQDFESGGLDIYWSANPDTLNNGIVGVANGSGANSTYGVRMGKSTDSGGYAENSVDLRLDLTGLNNEELVFNFDITDYNDENHAEDGVYFSDDGGSTFQQITEIAFVPQSWVSSAWASIRPFGFDFDDLMDKYGLNYSSTFVIRFQQYDNADFNLTGDEDGIRLDNVCLDFEKPLVYESIPYKQNFDANSDLGFYYEWHIGSDSVVDKTANFEAISRFARVRIANNIGTDGSYALEIGKSSDAEGININAVDLHLNIAGLDNEELVFNFDILDFNEDPHVEDGVYFSDNGGYTFQKITELNFTSADWVTAWAPIRPFGFDFDDLMDKYGLNYSSTFVIRFQQYDNADFNTIDDEDGIRLDNVCLDFEKPLIRAAIPYKQDFDANSDLDFYYEWHIGSDSVLDKTANFETISRFARVRIANNVGTDGSYALELGKSSDSEGANINAVDLYLDLRGLDNAELVFNFDILDFNEDPHVEDGVYFSDNGGYTFQKITELNFTPADWVTAWAPIRPFGFDFDDLMDKYGLNYNSNFVIRFQQYDNADFNTIDDEDGIRLDNICLDFEKPLVYESVPYKQNFDASSNLDDYYEWHISSDSVLNKTASFQTISRFAQVGIFNNIGIGGSYALQIGKSSDSEGYNINAVDLHLNLTGLDNEQLLFNFEILDFNDETHVEDGVYFSDDGGYTFQKITELDFVPADWVTALAPIQPYGFDFDELMANYQLDYSSTFVIRFQQYDNADFNTSGDEDGIRLDNVCLDFDKTVTYQTLPFCDNFVESCVGTNDCPLGEAWYINNVDAVNGISPTCSDTESLSRFARLEIWSGASSDGDGYRVLMGKHSDSEGFNTNALDLHLDLSGHQNNQVLLSFYLDLYAEESHLEDAIFISSDDGMTWVKSLTINAANLPSSGYNYIELDLSNEINSNASLSFSSTFIVRFQQYDNADFNTTNDEDGYIIDDVQVYANEQTCEIVNACLPSLMPSDSISTGLYHAGIDVQSDGIVPSGNVVEFKAGQIITLDNGFTVEQGADFSGEIEDCTGGN